MLSMAKSLPMYAVPLFQIATSNDAAAATGPTNCTTLPGLLVVRSCEAPNGTPLIVTEMFAPATPPGALAATHSALRMFIALAVKSNVTSEPGVVQGLVVTTCSQTFWLVLSKPLAMSIGLPSGSVIHAERKLFGLEPMT